MPCYYLFLMIVDDRAPAIACFVKALLEHSGSSTEEKQESLQCLNKLGVSFVTRAIKGQTSDRQNKLVDVKLSELVLEYGSEIDQRDFIIVSHILHYFLHDRFVTAIGYILSARKPDCCNVNIAMAVAL